MLVLGRKENEEIVIGKNEDIVIRVAKIHEGQVKICIDAPRSVDVHRREVFERIKSGKEG